jgi:hypothetical protein
VKFWRREPLGDRCGLCGHPIDKGAVELVYRFPERKVDLVRCATCAGEPVPDDVPALQERDVVALHPSVLTRKPARKQPVGIGSLAKDWKHAQSGDR